MPRDTESKYFERKPPTALADKVVCCWGQKIAGQAAWAQSIIPDGCADIVSIKGKQLFIAGPNRTAYLKSLPAGAEVAGIRLAPGVAKVVLGLPVTQLVDQEVSLKALWGRLANELEEKISQEQDIFGRQGILLAMVEQRLRTFPLDQRVCFAVRWIAEHPYEDMQDLARQLGEGPRQLHRLFLEYLGYGPKTLQRILRLQRVLLLRERRMDLGLADLAAESGFSDQPHMSREIRQLTGRQAASFLETGQSPLALSDLFKMGPIA
jgi:AraC-like DNA-binding protein